MHHKRVILPAIATSMILVAGCQSTGSTIKLGMADQGKTVPATPGASILVTLDSNVTTGYSWTLASPATTVLKKTGNTYIEPSQPKPGAGGQEQWTFAAEKPGTAPLRLEYRRPWEDKKAAPASVFECTIVVSEARK